MARRQKISVRADGWVGGWSHIPMNKSTLGTLWSPMWITDEPTHLLEGRKWEKWVGELRNMAHCK